MSEKESEKGSADWLSWASVPVRSQKGREEGGMRRCGRKIREVVTRLGEGVEGRWVYRREDGREDCWMEKMRTLLQPTEPGKTPPPSRHPHPSPPIRCYLPHMMALLGSSEPMGRRRAMDGHEGGQGGWEAGKEGRKRTPVAF